MEVSHCRRNCEGGKVEVVAKIGATGKLVVITVYVP